MLSVSKNTEKTGDLLQVDPLVKQKEVRTWFRFTIDGKRTHAKFYPFPLEKLKTEMFKILRSGSNAPDEVVRAAVDGMLKKQDGDHYHAVLVTQAGDMATSFSYGRAVDMKVGEKNVRVWHGGGAVLKGAQNKNYQSMLWPLLLEETLKVSDDTKKEVWFVETASNPISYQTTNRALLNVFPSAKYPTLDSFPEDAKAVYNFFKTAYPAVTHPSDLTMHKPASWQPNNQIDESRLDKNGRFFMKINPKWRDKNVVFFCTRIGKENWNLSNPKIWNRTSKL